MSCRSTRASSAAVSLAFAVSGLNETQVQSIFHDLKRESVEMEAPTVEEYKDKLATMQLRVSTDPNIKPFMRERLLKRLGEAMKEPPLDAQSWHAVENVEVQSVIAAKELDGILIKAADAIGVSEDKVKKVFNTWLDDKDGDSFEDVHVPDTNFRYDLNRNVPHDAVTARALRKLGYEEYLSQPYPVFVYGTLRPGQGNHVLMRDAVYSHSSGSIKGVGIYGAGRGFPYAAEHDDSEATTVGEVVWLTNNYEGVRARQDLDSLESFSSDWPSSSHYERVLKTITVKDGFGVEKNVDAWMYLARGYSRSTLKESDRILHGDWVEAKKAFQASPRQSFYEQLWSNS